MAMRRRSFRRVQRRGRPVRAITEPKRWEAANFSVETTQEVGANTANGTTVMFELVKHDDHIGDNTTAQGRTLSNIVSKFEVGGLVFDLDVQADAPEFEPSDLGRFTVTEFLATIGLDSAANPVTVPDFFRSQHPIIVASAGGLDDDETDYPTRIHWRKSYVDYAPSVGSDLRSHHQVVCIKQTKSLRLRRFIDDRQGLYIGATIQQNYAATPIFRVYAAGTLYYRVRF